MTSWTASADSGPDWVDTTPAHSAGRGLSWAVRLLVVGSALELVFLGVLVGSYAVMRVTYPEVQRGLLPFFGWQWGVAQGAVLALGLATAWLVPQQLQAQRSASAMTLAAIAVIYGLASLGVKGVEWGRWGGPHVITVPALVPVRPTGTIGFAARSGDAQAGAKAFGLTCAACHGAQAQGLPNTAPPLKPSECVTRSSLPQLTAVIIDGRAPTDPASKTGKAMPPRGGNPFLSDSDVVNIVAFLRSDSPGVSVAGPAAAPGWVVPPPPPGPPGLADACKPSAPAVELPAALRAQQPTHAERVFALLAAALTGLHAVHVLLVIAVTVALLWRVYASSSSESVLALARFGRVYWLLAMVMWMVLFPLLYLL